MVKGRCECGAIAFEVTDLRDTVNVRFTQDQGLTWYQSSPDARRGFCKLCGSSLFYQPNGAKHLAIAAGCLDLPTGMRAGKHIFTADSGDYYTIPDDAPHIPD
jgi:hypothetical protein